ncbi:MAG: hypothetical protein ACK4IS_09105 [Erythrobacter sp.]
MTQPKKMIVRDMTVNEVSTVDRPAQLGAVAVILKSGAVDIRKNASEVASGAAAPLYKAAEYGDAIMARAEEIGLAKGISAGKALIDYSVSDTVLQDLSCAERVAEAGSRKARNDAVFEASDKWS